MELYHPAKRMINFVTTPKPEQHDTNGKNLTSSTIFDKHHKFY